MRTIAVLQSNYIPWKGYFDLVHDVDLFVFYDDLQITKNDWRNRNKLKSRKGVEWISIPIGTDINRLICEVEINQSWQIKHWKTINQNYCKAPFYDMYKDFLEDVYLHRRWTNLSELNQYLIRIISTKYLGIKTKFRDSREYNLSGKKQDRLLELLIKVNAERYISGPAAKAYINPLCFVDSGIDLVWKDYSGYPEYSQFYPPFEHGVSILDLLFNVGPYAPWYIWGWQEGRPKP